MSVSESPRENGSAARLRVGVIGCGGIAQMMHLPHLRELHDRYEIAALCDLSPGVLRDVGADYGVTRLYTDYRALLAQDDIAAVLVLTAGSHAPVALAAAQAGKHLFVEKPLCYTLAEADAVLAAVRQANVTLMVGYMKRFDSGYLYLKNALASVERLRYVQVNVLHPAEEAYIEHHHLHRHRDIEPAALASLEASNRALVASVLGPGYGAGEEYAFVEVLLSSLVHDVNALRGLLGEPEEVLGTEIWNEGRCLVTTLRYTPDVHCVLAWTYLPDLRNYQETLAFYADAVRLRLEFPSPFLRNVPTPVVVERMDGAYAGETRIMPAPGEAFKEELLHFHHCVTTGQPPQTDGADARADVALLHRIFAARRPAH